MKKQTFLLLLCYWSSSIFTSFAFAQNANKALEKKNYSLAFEAFSKNLQEAKEDDDRVLAWLGLSKVYAVRAFERYNLDSAYNLSSRALTKFNKLKSNDRDHLTKREDITQFTLSKWRDGLVDSAFVQVNEKNTFEDYQHFLSFFGKMRETKFSKYKKQVIAKRNVLFNALLASKKSFLSIDTLLKTIGDELKNNSPNEYSALQQKHFEYYIKENGWDSVKTFSQQYPNNVYVRDTSYGSFERVRTSQDLKQFELFLEKHPKSLFSPFLKDSIGVYYANSVAKSNDLATLLNFIQTHPSSLSPKQIDAKLAALFQKLPALELVEKAFEVEKKRLSRFPITEKAVYEAYASYGRMNYLERFKKIFGAYSDVAEFQKDSSIALFLEQTLIIPEASNEALEMSTTSEKYEAVIAKAAPRHTAFQAVQILISRDVMNKKWQNALEKVEKIQDFFPKNDPRILELLATLRLPERTLNIETLGDSINTEDYKEYCPVVTTDGKTIYFCRNNSLTLGFKEDIYSSKKINGRWQKAQAVKALNSPSNEAPISISGDGTRLLVFSNGILTYADKDATRQWVTANSISPNINAYKWQGEATIASNGQVIIFEARRPDVLGVYNEFNIDLFISFKQPDGTWSVAKNLGNIINTFQVERSPFLHPDLRTLYFCSSGRGAIGGLDVYKTTRLDDTWLNWSAPQSLGKEINTPSNEWGYKISTDGSTAYFASKGDLFLVNPLPKELRPLPVSTIAGRLVGNDGKPIGDAKIIVENLKTGEKVGELRPDPTTGEYFATFPTDQPYGATIVKEGYLPVATHTNIDNPTQRNDKNEDLKLFKISELVEGKVTIPIPNLFFETDKYDIRAESFIELDRLADFIVQQKSLNLEIVGYTDNVGTNEHNKQLSMNRATAVRAYLIQKGCTASQLKALGQGELNPIMPNDTENNKAKNRRVEIRVARK